MGGKYDNEVKCNKICKTWKEEGRKEEKKVLSDSGSSPNRF